jgi:transposase
MPRKRRSFSDEFKRQSVRRAQERLAGGVALTQIGREIGVSTELLRRWLHLAAQAERPVGEGDDEVVTLAEVRRLRREVETLRDERDFAKKAAAFFARDVR